MEVHTGSEEDLGPRDRLSQLSPFEIFGTMTGLVLLGIVQPIFDLLSRNGTFFVARNSPALDIILFAVVVAFLLPAMLTAWVVVPGKIDRRFGHAIFIAAAGLLATLVVLRVIKLTFPALGGSTLILLPAAAVGGMLAWSVGSNPTLRWILKFSPLLTLAVVVWFLAFSPLSRVIFVRNVAPAPPGSIQRPADMVMLILDELPLATLLARNGQIDAELFPNFARLAESSNWYRNAITVSNNTVRAAPAILDGDYPVRGLLPAAPEHPHNVFTLLGSDYRVEAEELVTRMCPSKVCAPHLPAFGGRMGSLLSDVGLISAHMLLPEDLSENLSPVDENWGDFAVEDEPREVAGLPGVRSLVRAGDPLDELRAFITRIRSVGGPVLYFNHVLLPHTPWRYLPGGYRYPQDVSILGTVPVPGRAGTEWGDDQWLASQGYQRHILQTMAVDDLLGALLDKLQSTQMYEDSLVVVVSDHGTAFLAGAPRRSLAARTVGEIAPVAMFIKEPGQTRGRIVDLPVQTIDILPTVAALLEARDLWEFDGRALVGAAVGTTGRTLGFPAGRNTPYSDAGTELYRAVERKYETFGKGALDPYRLAPPGTRALIGRTAPTDSSPAPALATMEDSDRYADVDLSAGSVPALLRGRLESQGSELENPIVAVALNGTIAAVTEASEESEDSFMFQALLSPERFRQGRNVLELFLVERRNGTKLLLSLPQE